MSLASCFPQPVRITLGGCPFLAMELRVRELAELHAWRETFDPPPATRLGPPSAYPDHEAYLAHAREIYEQAEEEDDALACEMPPPPRPPDPARPIDPAQAEAMVIWLGLRGVNPGFTPEDAAELVMPLRASPDRAHEWERLREVVFALNPMLRVMRAIVPDVDAMLTSGESVPWARAIEETRAAAGLTYEEVGNLYLGQLDSLRSGGKSRQLPGVEQPPGVDPIAWAKQMRERFYGTPPSPGPAAADDANLPTEAP